MKLQLFCLHIIMDKHDSETAYQPIENYGVIGDLNTVALVSFTVQINGMIASDKTVDKKSYKQLSIPETDLLFEEGAPQVPVITELIAIPDCDDVSVSVTSANKMEFSDYYVVPALRI